MNDAHKWNGPIGRVTDRALALAGGVDDATKAATLLSEHAQTVHLDQLALFAGCRYRLANLLDRDPGDLVALAALGIVTLAGLEEPPEMEARRGALMVGVPRGPYRRRDCQNGASQ